MANNRLYIVDTETGEKILLAKGFGDGWSLRCTRKDLAKWMEGRDIGGSDIGGKTSLKLLTESDDLPTAQGEQP